MDPDYKKVIEILSSKPNYERIVWEIAKTNPKVVNEAYDLVNEAHPLLTLEVDTKAADYSEWGKQMGWL